MTTQMTFNDWLTNINKPSTTPKDTSTPQKKAPKRRKGLSEQVLQERFNEALNCHFQVNKDGKVIGCNNKPLTTKINERLAITFKMIKIIDGVNVLKGVHIYQEDFIRLWNQKNKVKTKPRYTATQVREFLNLQKNNQLETVFQEPEKANERILHKIKMTYNEYKLVMPTIEEVIGDTDKDVTMDYVNDLKAYIHSLQTVIEELYTNKILPFQLPKNKAIC